MAAPQRAQKTIDSAPPARRGSYRRRLDRASMGHWITASQDRLLRALVHCWDGGRSDPSVDELAARVGCHARTIQLGLARLRDLELILITPRPTRDGRNRTNVYTILPEAFARLHRVETTDSWVKNFAHPSDIMKKDSVTAKRSTPRRPANRGPGVPATLKSASSTENSASRASTRKDQKQEIRQDGGRVFQPDSPARTPDAPRTGPRPNPAGHRPGKSDVLAARAAAALARPGSDRTGDDAWSALDRERSIRLSRFHYGAWSRAVQAHGRENCLLAAAVAMLRPAAAGGDEIQSRAAYLGGMLRSLALDAAASLDTILAARQSPGTKK